MKERDAKDFFFFFEKVSRSREETFSVSALSPSLSAFHSLFSSIAAVRAPVFLFFTLKQKKEREKNDDERRRNSQKEKKQALNLFQSSSLGGALKCSRTTLFCFSVSDAGKSTVNVTCRSPRAPFFLF